MMIKVIGIFIPFAATCMLIGPISLVIGELLPRERFDYRVFPYHSFGFEDNGRIYLLIRVHRWKDRVPDASKIIRGLFKKKLGLIRDERHILGLIRETCVAEFVHIMLSLASPVFLFIFEGWQGYAIMAIYVLCNLPFIIIQRYNRPRLVVLMEREAARRGKK